MQPGEYHDISLPRPSHEGLFGTIYCSRCDYFGIGYKHPEWCTWQWLKETDGARPSLDLIEIGSRVTALFITTPPLCRTFPVLVRISVEATDEGEARLHVERLLAGRYRPSVRRGPGYERPDLMDDSKVCYWCHEPLPPVLGFVAGRLPCVEISDPVDQSRTLLNYG